LKDYQNTQIKSFILADSQSKYIKNDVQQMVMF